MIYWIEWVSPFQGSCIVSSWQPRAPARGYEKFDSFGALSQARIIYPHFPSNSPLSGIVYPLDIVEIGLKQIEKVMKPIVIQLGNLCDSQVNISGDIHLHLPESESDSELMELLLQSLEINRKLITGFCSQWENEEDFYAEIQILIELQKALELQVAQNLNS